MQPQVHTFATPLPRRPPKQAMAAAAARVASARLKMRYATRTVSSLNCNWIRAGNRYDLRQRAAALAHQQQSSSLLASANCNLAVLQRAHAISLYTDLYSIMKRKRLHANALQQLRERLCARAIVCASAAVSTLYFLLRAFLLQALKCVADARWRVAQPALMLRRHAAQ